MDSSAPCKICGCTQTNLIDGFYYCTECGTQDENVRETIIDYSFLGDGGVISSRRRITKIPQANELQMTDDWYRWHGLNFLLRGLADELVEAGAAPSFKTKLLWVWTRYMKKYQNKADFGLVANEESDENKEDLAMDDSDMSSDEDETNGRKRAKKYDLKGDIKKISMPLIISFLYVALNIDRSRIQLTHLLRFMREERISILKWQKLIPQELKPKKLNSVLFFELKAFRYSFSNVRSLSINLFRHLDLGNPIVPDLRLLVDEYMQELCLPNDLKPLVFSLMHYRSFDYLDVNVEYKDLRRMPSYELHVISHILMALKICFGLDCEYEVKVSDAVDKINDMEHYRRSYNSDPTKRLFSFRDWCSYIQFRKALLRTHSLYLGAPNYFDMNDYVASEHQKEKTNYKINLKDEISVDILNKMPGVETHVIPRSEFVTTMTPHTSYTRVIAEHLQDPSVKQLLCEDFTQYSLKYILEDMFLVDPDSPNPKNVLTGLCQNNVRENGQTFDFIDPLIVFSKGHAYVKDCENHNWTITQRPKLEHVSANSAENNNNCSENDNGYESDSETVTNIRKAININFDNNQNNVGEVKNTSVISVDSITITKDNLSRIPDIEMEIEKEENGDDVLVIDNSRTDIKESTRFLKIAEEDEDKQIYDDNFLDLETKKEDENEHETNDNEVAAEVSEVFSIRDTLFGYDAETQQYVKGDKESDVSSVDSIRLNPETLNRTEVIKELVIHACNKHKISIPGKFIVRLRTNKKKQTKKGSGNKINRPCYFGETTQKINGIISAYHSHIESDILHQMTNMVQSAIADFNQTKDLLAPVESEDAPRVSDEINSDTNDMNIVNEINDTNHEPEQNNVPGQDDIVTEVDQYKLFDDSSDGETHAEDLLPKKNPEFDEATHDISQLYIKPAENTRVPEMELDPKLAKIIDQQIEAEKNDNTLLQLSHTLEKDSTDSEEEVSLVLLQEQKRIREQLSAQEYQTKKKCLKLLIKNDIPPYKYWIRHYFVGSTQYTVLYQRFTKEVDNIFPKSFGFVLKECADVVGYPPYSVYKGLQNVEMFLKHKFVHRKRLVPSYFEKHRYMKKFKDF